MHELGALGIHHSCSIPCYPAVGQLVSQSSVSSAYILWYQSVVGIKRFLEPSEMHQPLHHRVGVIYGVARKNQAGEILQR